VDAQPGQVIGHVPSGVRAVLHQANRKGGDGCISAAEQDVCLGYIEGAADYLEWMRSDRNEKQCVPADVVAAGYAEFQPLDDADRDDAYRRNRRIEAEARSALVRCYASSGSWPG
jgi:hypothetical protein